MISKTVLVLAGPFAEGLSATRACAALTRGLTADGHLESDACALEQDLGARAGSTSKPLEEADFDRRMLAARAIVIACAHLDDHTLGGSIAFEAATRARQSGVPAYAVTGEDSLDRFEARIVDLQVILEAGTSRELGATGRKLATLV
ncbi:MAG TPA: hypothetical protein VGP18_00900 [Solirubrobacteraceae bacterium]|nr:hypothetical protein [Solirubrobacteraceae bacterium]